MLYLGVNTNLDVPPLILNFHNYIHRVLISVIRNHYVPLIRDGFLLLYPLFTRNAVSYPLSARRNGVSVIGIEHPYPLSA